MARTERLDRIRDAVRNGEFFLEYQPIVDLRSGRCAGAESTVRWRDGDRVVPPLEFAQDVEHTPVSGLLTYWVIEQVARDLGNWLKSQRNDVHIGINVPPELLGRGGIEYAAAKAGLTKLAHKFVLEVSERGLIDRLGVDALNARGGDTALIALDDVRLSEVHALMLSRVRVDMIKLDKSVTITLGDPGCDRETVETLKALASLPGLTLIGEGVEREKQAERLSAVGVGYGQGDFFSPPISAQEFIFFFDARLGGRQPL